MATEHSPKANQSAATAQEDGFPCKLLPWIEEKLRQHEKRMKIRQHQPWHPSDYLRVVKGKSR